MADLQTACRRRAFATRFEARCASLWPLEFASFVTPPSCASSARWRAFSATVRAAAESTGFPGHASAEWATNERTPAPQAPPSLPRIEGGERFNRDSNGLAFVDVRFRSCSLRFASIYGGKSRGDGLPALINGGQPLRRAATRVRVGAVATRDAAAR